MNTSDLLLVLGLVMVIQYFVRSPSELLSMVKANHPGVRAGGRTRDRMSSET